MAQCGLVKALPNAGAGDEMKGQCCSQGMLGLAGKAGMVLSKRTPDGKKASQNLLTTFTIKTEPPLLSLIHI